MTTTHTLIKFRATIVVSSYSSQHARHSRVMMRETHGHCYTNKTLDDCFRGPACPAHSQFPFEQPGKEKEKQPEKKEKRAIWQSSMDKL